MTGPPSNKTPEQGKWLHKKSDDFAAFLLDIFSVGSIIHRCSFFFLCRHALLMLWHPNRIKVDPYCFSPCTPPFLLQNIRREGRARRGCRLDERFSSRIPRLLYRSDMLLQLLLHPLDGVVDGLGGLVQVLADLLIGEALEIQAQDLLFQG